MPGLHQFIEPICHKESKKISPTAARKKILVQARENPSVVGQLFE